MKSKACGVAAGGALVTNIKSAEDGHNIGVTVGAEVQIDAKTPIHFAANEQADVTIQANSDAYGAATATGNKATIDVKPIKSVTIGSNAKVSSTKDVVLLAGMTSNLQNDDYIIKSNVDAFAGSLIPLDIIDSDAHLLQTNTIVVTQGAEVKSGGDILLYADGDDYQPVSAQAKGVNWTSGLLTLVNGLTNLAQGGVGQFAGESSTKATATVTVNGTLETGIGRHKTLVIENIVEPAEIDRDKPEAYQVVLSPNSDFSESDLVKSFLTVNSLDQTAFQYAKAQLQLSGLSPEFKRFYEEEVVRLREKMISAGLLETTSSGFDVVKGLETLNLRIPAITASSGAIRIFADTQIVTTTLKAPSDPSITITNKTYANLTTSELTIPDHNGGVFFNSILTTERGTTPTITVENERDVSADTGRPWPGINVEQSINNPNGDVTLKNFSTGAGSIDIIETASIHAATQTITAGNSGALNINLGGANSVFEAGGSAYQQVLPFSGPTVNRDDGTAYLAGKGTTAINNLANRPLNALKGSTSGLKGARVILKAAYVNLNGLIQSGRTDYTLEFTQAMRDEASMFSQTKTTGLHKLTTNKDDGFSVQFDAVNKEIVVGDIAPVGGYKRFIPHRQYGRRQNSSGQWLRKCDCEWYCKLSYQIAKYRPVSPC